METKQIEVSISGQTYRFACQPENEASLREAAARVCYEMGKIKKQGNAQGTDRLAINAAISLAISLLQSERYVGKGESLLIENVQQKLKQMDEEVDDAIRKCQS